MERAPIHKTDRKQIVGGLSAIAMSLGGLSAYSAHETGDPMYAFELVSEHFSPKKCGEPSEDTILGIESTLAQETHKPAPLNIEKYTENYHLLQEVAQYNGFTMINPSPYLRRIDEITNPQQMLRVAQAYFLNFGIDVIIEGSHNQFGSLRLHQLYNKSIQESNITLQQATKLAKSLIVSGSFLPLEMVRDAGTKNIYIVKDLRFGTQDLSGFYHSEISSIFLNISSYNEGGNTHSNYNNDDLIMTLLHELLHGVDNNLCGDYKVLADDAVFKEFYSPYNKDYISDYAFVETIEGDFWEDRVETMMNIFTLNTQYGDNDDSTIIDDKFRFMLARLDENYSGFSDYIVEASKALR